MNTVERQQAKALVAAVLIGTLKKSLRRERKRYPRRKEEIRRRRFTITVKGDFLNGNSDVSLKVEPRSETRRPRIQVRFVD